MTDITRYVQKKLFKLPIKSAERENTAKLALKCTKIAGKYGEIKITGHSRGNDRLMREFQMELAGAQARAAVMMDIW